MQTAFYKKPNICHLAIHLLLKANHQPHTFLWNGKAETIHTGQVLTGRKALSQETGQSQRQVRTALSTLSDSTIGFMTIKTTNKFSIISIAKYCDYQAETTTKATNKRPTNDQQLTTNNNEEEGISMKKNTTTAPDKPGVGLDGQKPVNWANCKSPIQRVIAKYVELGQPALYAHATQAEATGLFKEQGKAVGPILAQCGGDVAVAVRVVELAAAYYGKKGLDWSLYAVSKNCGDFLNTVKKEQNYGANR